MRWSIKLGRILGIDVYLHVTFLLLLAFIGFSNWMATGNPTAAVIAVVFMSVLFGCVLLHEFGHALAARGYGIHTQDIVLLPIGGVARLDRMPEKPTQELWVALAGPLVNVVIATGLFIGLKLKGAAPVSFDTLTVTGSVQDLLRINVYLALFNLLPAFPMDGGRVLRALLALRLPYARATRIAASVGQTMAVIFGFVGLFKSPILLLIAVFVWIGASQEAAAAELKSSTSGARVRDAMLTQFRTLSPDQTLAAAVHQLLAGCQQDFPVLDAGGRLVGILPRRDLIQALQNRGEHTPIEVVMTREFPVVQAEDFLDDALAAIRPDRGLTTLPVFRRGEFAGLLTPENVGEFFMIRAALGHRGGEQPPEDGVPPVITSSQYERGFR